MTLLWQQIAVGAALVVAGLYLVTHFYRRRKSETGREACPALEALKNKASTEEKTSSV